MALDESLYHPLMPLEDQGRGAFVRGYQRHPALGKRRRQEAATETKDDSGKRKMRRTTSAKLADHSQNMMTSFLSHGGEEASELVSDQWMDSNHIVTPPRSATPPYRPNIVPQRASSEAGHVPHQAEPGLFSGVLCLVHGHDEKKVCLNPRLCSGTY